MSQQKRKNHLTGQNSVNADNMQINEQQADIGKSSKKIEQPNLFNENDSDILIESIIDLTNNTENPELDTLSRLEKKLELLQVLLKNVSKSDSTFILELESQRDVLQPKLSSENNNIGKIEKNDEFTKSNIEENEAIKEKNAKNNEDALEQNNVKNTENEVEEEDKQKKSMSPEEVARMENDPSVQNPKAEFVVSQTLPAAAAALGLFNESSLAATGEEALRKKYAVASYPARDLKETLPGPIPDGDFTGPKPTNQIQFATFLASVEPYYKPFADEDLRFLQESNILPSELKNSQNYDPDVTPYIIPKLGIPQSQPINNGHSTSSFNNGTSSINDLKNKSANQSNVTSAVTGNSELVVNSNTKNADKASKSSNTVVATEKESIANLRKDSLPHGNYTTDMDESVLESENKVSCGPLVSRLLAAVMHVPSTSEQNWKVQGKLETSSSVAVTPLNGTSPVKKEDDDGDHDMEQDLADDETNPNLALEHGFESLFAKVPQPGRGWPNSLNMDYQTLDDRLQNELKYVGIYLNLPRDENGHQREIDWVSGREDDEISAELRSLQKVLKQVSHRTKKRKKILQPIVKKRLAWQEYWNIKEDLDKQLDQAYIKRIRVPKKRKKHHSSTPNTTTHPSISHMAQQKAANSSLKSLIDKRSRWINKIGPLFDKEEVMLRIAKESIFSNMDEPEEEEDEEPYI
ncbi:hypothetical protein TBLA_0H03120 [Henningerozyma blattae CBS 6284]|uniref:Uncharacterized protein n=1 Tax=Henningerozyma blattae (strain ATCC 34711 / CBS 6284 / DSM 70876 / NBRC 10599 / NRRL Y-10934 / UCD 77-7) TaxID=1071380 RepID=I2H891_HENB6|nr:hypothetical protein TBLA_0H03120 [Tetrapisispora blattae CBS 6284]CCH62593.1 hypothetical protein TBLA_0H03120 [Tetrapisispora blattae CBS 6284]